MAQNLDNIFFNGLPDFETEAAEEKRRARMPKEPTFSLKDMEQARAEARQKGYDEGLEAAKLSIEQKTEILIQSVVEDIESMKGEEENRYNASIQNAVSMAYQSIEIIIAPLLDQEKENLIQSALHDFFADHISKSKLALYVHPDMKDPVSKYITMLNPDIELKTDQNMHDTNAKIEWVDGVFDFQPDKLVQNILSVISSYNDTNTDTLDDHEKTPHNEQIETDKGDIPHE
jgi:flagellar biosynthesis/type III secretory pathway protein FliH